MDNKHIPRKRTKRTEFGKTCSSCNDGIIKPFSEFQMMKSFYRDGTPKYSADCKTCKGEKRKETETDIGEKKLPFNDPEKIKLLEKLKSWDDPKYDDDVEIKDTTNENNLVPKREITVQKTTSPKINIIPEKIKKVQPVIDDYPSSDDEKYGEVFIDQDDYDQLRIERENPREYQDEEIKPLVRPAYTQQDLIQKKQRLIQLIDMYPDIAGSLKITKRSIFKIKTVEEVDHLILNFTSSVPIGKLTTIFRMGINALATCIESFSTTSYLSRFLKLKNYSKVVEADKELDEVAAELSMEYGENLTQYMSPTNKLIVYMAIDGVKTHSANVMINNNKNNLNNNFNANQNGEQFQQQPQEVQTSRPENNRSNEPEQQLRTVEQPDESPPAFII